MTIWVPIVVAAATLAGALGSQLIAGWHARRLKRLELEFARKADAYAEFIRSSADFFHDPRDEDKYMVYLKALMEARLLASRGVADALNGSEGVNAIAQRLRHQAAFDQMQMFFTQGKPLHEAMDRTVSEMQADLLRVVSSS